MDKCVAEGEKAKEYESRADYWKRMENKIDLSMTESIEYFEYKLGAAKMLHEDLKSGKIEKRHSFSLTYAKKDVNELIKKFEIAKKLWN